MSHSPLLDYNRAESATEDRFHAALDVAAKRIAENAPDLTVIFFPDHINGFFYNLMPAFCVGAEAQSIGDYGSTAGPMAVPTDLAMDLSEFVLGQGVDTAVSFRMEVDHGGAQPLELLSGKHDLSKVIPIFINCAAAPRPGFDRVRALGRAVGAWAAQRPERILILGSGGLSHDPPVPALETATPEQRRRLIDGGTLTHAQRQMRKTGAVKEGLKMRDGTSGLLPINPEWDRTLMDAFLAGDLKVLDRTSDTELTATGGRGGHEIRCWVAALAALGADYTATELFYEPIDVWLTGMGILAAEPA
ncbi:3-carboxyethylcatechol 2,3-dioxygenase [Pararhodobacter oceanensis]|uniref:3-carboxyethylcatechol 2,3-dioxygenase n=1 Tax=Pararhodobacter oceanensis TaxID=2172121 RepID=UPI003A8FBB8B